MKKFIITALIILFSSSTFCQVLHPVKWSYGIKRINRNEAIVYMKASIDDGWHIYSVNQADGGPVRTSFIFTPSKDYQLLGEIAEPKPITKFEDAFNMNVKYLENSVVFQQKVRLKSAHPIIVGKLNFMVCNNQKCLPPEDINFSIPIK